MKYLVYGILRNDACARSNPIAGIDGGPIHLVSHGGIAAACSQVRDPIPVPDASRAMAYARVVDALHGTCTVLPMRYGRLFQDREQIAQFLQRQSIGLNASLEGVDGCEEMGVRALLRAPAPPLAAGGGAVNDRLRLDRGAQNLSTAPACGADYLTSRKAVYAERDRSREEAPEVADAILHSLDGLFLRSQTERSPAGDKALLSLCFLIRRDGVRAFRQAFQQLRAQSDRALLLSGPWPPYTFVSLDKA